MTTGPVSLQEQVFVLAAYHAYNAQDLPRLLALLHDRVDWPDDAGNRLRGKDAVAAYWREQWTRVRAHDHPVAMARADDGRIVVDVEQVVRALDGSTVSTGTLQHALWLDGTRVMRLDAAGAGPPRQVISSRG